MGPTRQYVAGIFKHMLCMVETESADIAREMTRQELSEVLNLARSGSNHEVACELVSIALRVEMRQIEEPARGANGHVKAEHEAAICRTIESGQRRMEVAIRRWPKMSTSSPSSDTAKPTSICGTIAAAMSCSGASDARPQIHN
jgi:hypothetical protein